MIAGRLLESVSGYEAFIGELIDERPANIAAAIRAVTSVELAQYRVGSAYAAQVANTRRILETNLKLPLGIDYEDSAKQYVEYCFARYQYAFYLLKTLGATCGGKGLSSGLPEPFWEDDRPLVIAPLHVGVTELIGPLLAAYRPTTQLVVNTYRYDALKGTGLLDHLDYRQISAFGGMALTRSILSARSGRLFLWAPDVYVGGGGKNGLFEFLDGTVRVGNALDFMAHRLAARKFCCWLEFDSTNGFFDLHWQMIADSQSLVSASFEILEDHIADAPGEWFGWTHFDLIRAD